MCEMIFVRFPGTFQVLPLALLFHGLHLHIPRRFYTIVGTTTHSLLLAPEWAKNRCHVSALFCSITIYALTYYLLYLATCFAIICSISPRKLDIFQLYFLNIFRTLYPFYIF